MEKRCEKQGQVVPAASLRFCASKETNSHVFIATINVHLVSCKPVSSFLFEKEYPTTVYTLGSSTGHPEPVPSLFTNVAFLYRDLRSGLQGFFRKSYRQQPWYQYGDNGTKGCFISLKMQINENKVCYCQAILFDSK